MIMSYYGFLARLDAIFHKITHLRHQVLWRTNADNLCPGDITCEDCDILFWCRAIETVKIMSDDELMEKMKESSNEIKEGRTMLWTKAKTKLKWERIENEKYEKNKKH